MLGPILQGRAVSLEPAEPSDLETFRLWFADREITRFLLVRFPFSPSEELAWYERAGSDPATVHWKIVAGNRTIGSTALHTIDHLNRSATSGTVIGDRSVWGRGYGSEVVQLRTRFAFEELNLERLETCSFAENVPMHRALEKAGYQKFGCRRHAIYRGGTWHDLFLFELLRDEWQAPVT